MIRSLLAVLLVAGCGGAPVDAGPDAPDEALEARATLAPLALPGSRLSLEAPPSLARVPHTLRFEDPARDLRLIVSDTTVEPGEEPALAEAYLARVRRSATGEVRMRPISLRGAEGVELTLDGAGERLRVLTVWRAGRIARLSVRHRADQARLVERVIDSARFDPDAPVDPLAALDMAVAVPEGMLLLPISNEQLLLREGERAAPFPCAGAAIDVLYLPFREGERPADARARGQLLGSRFAGLRIDPPEITPVLDAAYEGIELVTSTLADGTELSLYGAYLEGEDGALLVRASVDAASADTWLPRFRAFVRSLRPRR